MLERENDLLSCGLGYAFHVIGGKWKPYILWYLYCSPNATCRYSELKRNIPWVISHKMFSQQLRELEQDGLIVRSKFDEAVLRVEYTLTDKAWFLVPVILYMRDWGVMFCDELSTATMVNTKGAWNGTEITYGYQSSAGVCDSCLLSFGVGMTKEEAMRLKDDKDN